MPPVVVFPDAELVAVGYLRTALAGRPESYAQGVTVGVLVPNPRTPPFVQVRRIGGLPRWPVMDVARLDLQVWHNTSAEAQNLAQLLHGLMWAVRGQAVGGTTVAHVEDFAGPMDFPDPDSTTPRYLLTVEWSLRGTTV